MEHNGYQQYQEQAIFSMSQNELLLLLLNELIKRLGRCDLALTQKNYALLDESADRCLAIVRYLDDTLNHDYPISADLHRLYDFFYYELSRVKVGRNKDELAKIKPMLVDLSDTFQQAAKNSDLVEKSGNFEQHAHGVQSTPQPPQAPNAQERNVYAER